jgi:hypothetical protein
LPCQDAISGMPAGDLCGHDDAVDLPCHVNLLDFLARVPDPRRRHGTRHRIAVVLALAVAAVMAGAYSVSAIAEKPCTTSATSP